MLKIGYSFFCGYTFVCFFLQNPCVFCVCFTCAFCFCFYTKIDDYKYTVKNLDSVVFAIFTPLEKSQKIHLCNISGYNSHPLPPLPPPPPPSSLLPPPSSLPSPLPPPSPPSLSSPSARCLLKSLQFPHALK